MIKIQNEEYLDAGELSLLLEIAKGTLLNWVSDNRIPSIKLGKKRIFHLGTINKWLQKNIE
jgi:excisionase family DNA binding protein